MKVPSRTPGRAGLALRAQLLLVVVLGVVLPLGMVGLWVARSAERSGEELLRERLGRSLHEIVQVAGTSWVDLRTDLLELGADWGSDAGATPSVAVAERWAALDGQVERVELLGAGGQRIGLLERRSSAGAGVATIPVELPLHDAAGTRSGTLRASVRTSTLLPGDLLLTGVGVSVLGAFTAGNMAPALPVSIDSDLLLRPRFRWNGEDWVAVQRGLSEPPLHLALAGPVAPFTRPFAEAARRGTLALLLAVVASSLLVILATRRITGPLEDLAQAADSVTRGELEPSVAERGPSEVRRLGRAFNTMVESLRRTLERLSQGEAVAAVGEFASALAHEVRNPLTSIRLDLQRAAERLPEEERPRELVERALAEVRRLDATVGGALRLARSGRLQLAPLDPVGPMRAAANAARPRFGEREAVLEPIEAPARPVRVRADEAALEQVVLNLLLNAADALPPGGRARLVLEPDGRVVRIRVEDEGEGIPPQNLQRIFEPFFSTKAEGTGLGLPIARRMAHAMGGELEVGARTGGGTVVTLVLPPEDEGP